jgi:hypothetical protein
MVGFVEVGTRVHSEDLGELATLAAASAVCMVPQSILLMTFSLEIVCH